MALAAAAGSPPPGLAAALDECMEAMNSFLCNHFDESLEKLQPRTKESMYHALVYATILEMQAMMTFEHEDIVQAGQTMKEAQEICQSPPDAPTPPTASEYQTDDRCLLLLLKGLCLKHLQSPAEAEACFSAVQASEKRLRYDHYLVPNALLELGLLHLAQGRSEEAVPLLRRARNNYKNYSMESRTLFRIHAVLSRLKADQEENGMEGPSSS
ncbi:hypothetical protein KIL84_021192 [Mauremys mutica]|uniref:Tetratricopeptide repeat protein 39A n=1 Tax=Mauremys mutica TaxID=74926 RepID=A0A9D4AZR7_9SAUR|nr:hypothetical protein KIL84_021192 [Mauremys mutica]